MHSAWVLLLTLGASGAPLDEDHFISYGRLKTWVGVAIDWDRPGASPHFYSPRTYRGHADYVSVGLKTGLRFSQFKQLVRSPGRRRYVPFLLYDVRALDLGYALFVEDYQYEDDSASMAALVIRLSRMLERQLNTSITVLLARSTRVKPNTSIAPQLQKAGFQTTSISRLLSRAQARAVEILNPGTGIGRLRVASAKDDLLRFSAQDIVIFEALPQRLPPVAGIVTLTAQTPLSHVNILARNRGTVNIYARSLEVLPGAVRHLDKLVELVATKKKVLLRPVSEARAKRFWKKRARRVEIPAPSEEAGLGVVNLQTGEKVDTPHVGAKAANYAKLSRGLARWTRPGFAIGFAPYRRVVEQTGADRKIKALLESRRRLSRSALSARLEEIRGMIERGSVPKKTISSVRRLLAGADEER